ncbi:MAG: FAD-dependent oxidoreductase [Betaproteobacteria bacterium]|nr:FAD-dependent oxidoreductase [Betaproteobacteria bacterium]
MKRAQIDEPGRKTPILGEYDVVVLGGGPAGIAAAAAAGRTGRSTVLIERYGFLGGAGTAAGLSTFCGLHANVHGEHKQVVHGLADEILGRLEKMGGLNAPHLSLANKITAQAYDISAYKSIIGVDPAKAGRAWETIPKLMDEAAAKGRRFPRRGALVRPQKNPIEWRANVTQIKNPDGSAVSGIDVEQMSYGEIEGRRQCWDVFEFIKEATPGFENAYIVEIAPQIGIRETRRVLGEYLLSEADVLECASFADAIGVNGWPVEAHVAGNVALKFPPIPESRGFNQLPYRMIVPQGIDNLFVAGRCASMTHDGQSSARVSGPCFAMGQAAGTAAHLALKDGCAPRAVDVKALQERLETDGAYLGFGTVGQTAVRV